MLSFRSPPIRRRERSPAKRQRSYSRERGHDKQPKSTARETSESLICNPISNTMYICYRSLVDSNHLCVHKVIKIYIFLKKLDNSCNDSLFLPSLHIKHTNMYSSSSDSPKNVEMYDFLTSFLRTDMLDPRTWTVSLPS